MWELKHAIHLALLEAPVRATPLTEFSTWFSASVGSGPYSASAVEHAFQVALDGRFAEKADSLSDFAKRKFAQAEVLRVYDAGICSDDKLTFEGDIEARFRESLLFAKQRLASFGINVAGVGYNLVDRLPSPYHTKPFSALVADQGDHIHYGIEPGTYFVKDKLWPVFSRVLMLHEIAHIPISHDSPMALARGLEEGICELVGFFDLAPRLLGMRLAESVYFSHRVVPPTNRMMRSYREFVRQALPLLRRYGWEGIYRIVRNGRSFVKTIERVLWADRDQRLIDQLDLPTGDFGFVNNAEYAASSPSGELFCSPAGVLIYEHAKVGRSETEIAVAAGVPLELVRLGLEELEGTIRYVGQGESEPIISFADTDTLPSLLCLRAEF